MKNRKIHYIAYVLLSVIPLLCYLFQGAAALPIFDSAVMNLLSYTNYLLLAMTCLFALYLNQLRATICVAINIVIYHYCLIPTSFDDLGINAPRFLELITLAWPLCLAVIFFHHEFSWRSLKIFKVIALALFPFALFAFWIADFKESYLQMAYFHFVDYFRPLEVPQFAFITLIPFCLVSLTRLKDKAIPFISTSIIALIPLYTLAHVGMDFQFPDIGKTSLTILSYTTITLMLFHTLFYMYWQRVYLDELTQIANRRDLDETLSGITGDYTIGMVDIDHFKKFNDTFGHDAGDDVLKVVANVLAAHSRKAKVFRYGGEEFTLLFRNLDSDEAFAHADELRELVSSKDFFIRQKKARDKKDRGKISSSEKKKVQITISIGLAERSRNLSAQEVIKQADKGLYLAKEAGRNCVKIA